MSRNRSKIWTLPEVQKLIDGYETGQTYSNLAKLLNRSEDSLKLKLYSLRSAGQIIQHKKIYPDDWSIVEDEFLMQNLGHMSTPQLAAALNRTSAAIKKRISQLDRINTKAKRASWRKRRNVAIAREYSGQLPAVVGRSRIGPRPHLGVTVRSSWENNFLVYLNHKKIKWEYEPRVFVFEDYLRGARSYLPDVYLPEEDKWIEVKGRLQSISKTKTRKFKKFYPEEFAKLEVVVQKNSDAHKFYVSMGVPVYAFYDVLEKRHHNLPNWEGKPR